MTDQLEHEDNAGAGATGTPIPSPSVVTLSASDIERVVAALEKNPALMGRIAQSAKDRTTRELQPQLDDFKGKLEELKRLQGAGLSETAALEIMEIRQNASPRPATNGAAPTAPIPRPGSRGEEPTAFDPSPYLQSVNLDPNDPEFLKLYRDGPVDAARTLEFIKAKNTRPAANAAQVMPMGGGSAPASEETVEEVTAKLEKAMEFPSKNMPEIIKLNQRLREMTSK
jgi:hypothetical protein